MACQDASAKINTVVSAFPASPNLKKLINAGMKDKNPMGGAYTTTNVDDAITNLVPTLWSAAQSSDQFMTNALFFNSVWGTYNCLDSVQDQNSFNLCMVSLTQQDEQFRSDAAASGSFFAKIMMPTMIFLQLLFFGFAPIVIIYGLFKGAGALMAYVKYLGFGVWTSSWLPFSAVIQMYIQNDVADKLAQFTEKGLVPSNLQAVYYDVLATRLGIASDMLAATPLISAAMLGVTGYGMVSLASRWSGRDHNDEKLQSPDILKNGAHVDVASRNQYSAEYKGSAKSGIAQADANWNEANLKQTLGQSTQSALGEDRTKRSESSSAVEASLRQVMSYKSGDTWSNQEMQSLERSHTSMTQQAMKMGDKIADSLGLTGSKRDTFKQNFNAEVGFSGIFGGVKAGVASTTGKEMSQDQATKINSEFGTEIAKNESDMKGWKAAAATAFSHSSGKEAATENGLSRRLSSTTADTQSSFQRFQKATSAESSVSAGVTISEATTGGNLISSPEGMQALRSAISNLDSSQRETFNKKFPELETRYGQRSIGMQGKRESAQLWALRTVDNAAFANVISAMQNGSISGPTDNNAERAQGVGSRAQQVSDNPGGNVANANIGTPSTNVPGVSADQVGPSSAPQQQTLNKLAGGLDEYKAYEDRETHVNSQMPGGVLNGQDQIRAARNKVENGDTSISAKEMTDTMSMKPITNTVKAVGNKEQQWEGENPKTAMAVNAGSLLIPGLGWGGAAARGVQFGRAGVMAYRAAEGVKVAEAGVEVAQAARVANAAGHEIPAVLRAPGQASRIVDAEHVKEAADTAAAASKALSSAGREAKNATKLAAKTSADPAMFITARHMADNHNAEAGTNAGSNETLNPGSAVHSMRQESNQDQSQQPMMMPMSLAPAADPLAPLGGHSGDLRSVVGREAQQQAIGPVSAHTTPVAHSSAGTQQTQPSAPLGGQQHQPNAHVSPQEAPPAPVSPGTHMTSMRQESSHNEAQRSAPLGGQQQHQPNAHVSPQEAPAAPVSPGTHMSSMSQEPSHNDAHQSAPLGGQQHQPNAQISTLEAPSAPVQPATHMTSMRLESNHNEAQQSAQLGDDHGLLGSGGMNLNSDSFAAGAPNVGHSALRTESNHGELSANLTATGGSEDHLPTATIGSGIAIHTPLTQESNHGLGGHETGLTANLTVGGGGNESPFGDGLMGATGADSRPLFGSNEGQRPAPRVNYNPTPSEGTSSDTPAPGGRGGDAKDSGPRVRGSR